jgi:hypothetical protein
VADVDNNGVPFANPSPEQFWMMRYLFVPVFMPPKQANLAGHVALLVICPVIKTLEFLDSDNEPADADYTHGLVGRIMQWMSAILDKPTPQYTNAPQFVPEEWQFRDSRSKQQIKATGDCGVFAVTQAQYMAFGYDYSQSEKQNWPADCNWSLTHAHRRYRITTDLTGEGVPASFFTFFNPEFRLNHIQNHQYYPIIDTPPVLAGRTWREYRRHPHFATLLTPTLRNRRTCYVDCRYKSWLAKHCRRNLRFYPRYTEEGGPHHSLKRFREWVELMDEARRSGAFIPKPYDRDGHRDTWPRNWIEPRESTTAAQCRATDLLDPLW